jgi:hypothetical protein
MLLHHNASASAAPHAYLALSDAAEGEPESQRSTLRIAVAVVAAAVWLLATPMFWASTALGHSADQPAATLSSKGSDGDGEDNSGLGSGGDDDDDTASEATTTSGQRGTTKTRTTDDNTTRDDTKTTTSNHRGTTNTNTTSCGHTTRDDTKTTTSGHRGTTKTRTTTG